MSGESLQKCWRIWHILPIENVMFSVKILRLWSNKRLCPLFQALPEGWTPLFLRLSISRCHTMGIKVDHIILEKKRPNIYCVNFVTTSNICINPKVCAHIASIITNIHNNGLWLFPSIRPFMCNHLSCCSQYYLHFGQYAHPMGSGWTLWAAGELKDGLVTELLRETCKRDVILQHKCLVTLKLNKGSTNNHLARGAWWRFLVDQFLSRRASSFNFLSPVATKLNSLNNLKSHGTRCLPHTGGSICSEDTLYLFRQLETGDT